MNVISRSSASLIFLSIFCHPLAEDTQYSATIYRDDFGVPHIVGDSLEDVAFGDGYAQASDRLELVLANIQAANGTRASVQGKRFLRSDITARIIGARHRAYQFWNQVAPRMQGLVSSYAAGLNQFQEDNPEALPVNAQKVEPEEVLAFLYYMTLARQFTQARKDQVGAGEVPISGEGAVGDSVGSNGWVLAPSRSVSGNPIVLTDPHTPWSGMNRWYEKHYITPTLNAYGAGSTGMPLFVFASTSEIAWTMTRNTGDRGDCFVVPLDPKDKNRYLLDGQSKQFKRRIEMINVRGEDPVKQVILETVHGPVFNKGEGRALAAGMSLYGIQVASDSLLQLVTAQDVKGIGDALALNENDGSQVFAADRKGNIFYGWSNRISVRSDQYNWLRAVDGSRSESLYRGVLGYHKVPQSMNDSSGYYQGSNAPNWAVDGGAWGINPSNLPTWLRGFIPVRKYLPSRSQRVVDLIESRPRHSLSQVKDMALDTLVLSAEWAMPFIEKAVLRLGTEARPEVGQALQILKGWVQKGPYATPESRGYSIYREICEHLKTGNLNDLRNQIPWPGTQTLPDATLRPLYSAVSKAVENMLKLYGTVSIEWSRINSIELSDGRSFTCGVGDATTQTVWQGTQVGRSKEGTWRVGAGSDFLMATELSAPPTIYTLVPYGQSNDPNSPHFADQTNRWLDGRWKGVPFTLQAVEGNAKSRTEVSSGSRSK